MLLEIYRTLYSEMEIRNIEICRISDSHSAHYEEYGVLGCNVVWFGKRPIFQRVKERHGRNQ
jgi:hypothetical protein